MLRGGEEVAMFKAVFAGVTGLQMTL